MDSIAGDQFGMFDFMPGFVCVLGGPDHVFRYANEAYRTITGRRELLGRTVRDAFPDLVHQGFYELLDGVYATGEPYTAHGLPVSFDQTDGERYIDLHYTAMRGKDGAITGIFVGGYDVTDSYRARERWRILAASSDDLRLAQDVAGMSGAASRILGEALRVSRAGYVVIDDSNTPPGIEHEWTAADITSPGATAPLIDFETLAQSLRRDEVVVVGDVRLDPRTRDVAAALEKRSARAFVGAPVIDREQLVGVLYVTDKNPRRWRSEELDFMREVADRARTAIQRMESEIVVRDSEARHRKLFDAIDEGFCIIEFFDGPHGPLSDYIHIQANAAYARHAGIANVTGQKLREMVGDEADDWVARYGGVLATGEPIRFQRELEATGRFLELSAFRIEPPSLKQVAVLFQDITARKKAEQALRESEEQFRAFAQAVPNHVWASHPDGEFHWFNDQFFAYTGENAETLKQSGWQAIVHPDDLPSVIAAWDGARASGSIYETELRLRRADGVYRWFLGRAEPVRALDGTIVNWIGTNTDIENNRQQGAELARLNATLEQEVEARTTELMVAEETLRQSQKMEAVGQLTGGLAHDFNNILAGIGGSLEVMSTRLAQGRVSELDRYLTGATSAVKRAAGLTQRLLAFSRRQTLDPKPTNLNTLINGMLELINRSVGPEINVETAGAAGLWTTFVDAGQLENALLNLCINARDAMPGGGKLTIETGNRWMDERAARQRDLEPGQYVSLCVSDTGTGMTPEVISRAFDPFFTTKPIGQGTGLGLSMVYGFAGQSGGAVRIYSEIDKGTMICIYLPRHQGEVDADETNLPSSSDAPRAEGGETILLVDDEPLIRMIASEQLEELGYTVIEAGDAAAAIKVLNSPRPIQLLVTDVGLPGGMNGRQLADAARVSRPELEVLFITGYAENAVLNHGHLDPGMHVMTKPFQMEAFAKRVKDLIAKG